MKVPDRQKREEADWGTLKERDKGGKTSPLEAKEDNRRATRQSPPRPFAMSNTSIRIFISMKYERYKKNSSFSYYMSEFSPNNYFEIILVENSICIAIYILYPKSFFHGVCWSSHWPASLTFAECIFLWLPTNHRYWWEMMKNRAQ